MIFGFPEINVLVTVLSAGIGVPRTKLPFPVASGYEQWITPGCGVHAYMFNLTDLFACSIVQ